MQTLKAKYQIYTVYLIVFELRASCFCTGEFCSLLSYEMSFELTKFAVIFVKTHLISENFTLPNTERNPLETGQTLYCFVTEMNSSLSRPYCYKIMNIRYFSYTVVNLSA